MLLPLKSRRSWGAGSQVTDIRLSELSGMSGLSGLTWLLLLPFLLVEGVGASLHPPDDIIGPIPAFVPHIWMHLFKLGPIHVAHADLELFSWVGRASTHLSSLSVP